MDIVPCKRKSGFRNPINFCSWNLGSGIFLLVKYGILSLESGVDPKESGIPLTIGIRNPSSTDEESGIQALESGIHDVESRFQCCGFSYIGRS